MPAQSASNVVAMRPSEQATLAPVRPSAGAPLSDGRSMPARIGIYALIVTLAGAAWVIRNSDFYTPGKGAGYALGATGATLMVLLLLYPVRKRVPFMRDWGALKHWFRLHMLAGVIGPVLVLFHSTFHIGSFNAGVAMFSMILVATSGFVGRFLYREIHHGLYGAKANVEELQQILARDFKALEPVLQTMPAVREEIDRFAALVSAKPQGTVHRATHFLSLGARRLAARRRVRRAVAGHKDLTVLLGTIDRTLQEVQRTAQFSTYERLFSIWHAVHIPFLGMLVLTAVVHVVAVHFY